MSLLKLTRRGVVLEQPPLDCLKQTHATNLTALNLNPQLPFDNGLSC